MDRKRGLFVRGGSLALLLVLVGCGNGNAQVPTFVVDALWPQPLEYPYILGPVSGVTVAPDGNILIVTRQDGFNAGNEINSVQGTGDCCTPTSAVLEYAPDGRLVRQWGGPDQGYPWPQRPHGIAIDPDGNIWIGGGVVAQGPGGGGGGGGGGAAAAAAPARPPVDTHLLKFSRTGQFLGAVGQVEDANPSSQSMASFGGAVRVSFHAASGEAFVADGLANRRVAVVDIATGQIKRVWGAYGNEPSDADLGAYSPSAPPAQQFRSVTCAEVSNDGLVYVCDRGNNRLQVFRPDGTFVSEVVIAPATLALGSVWDVAFSPDANQTYMYVADGTNERVYILLRETLEVRTSFGVGGRYPSHFRELGSVAVDAQGNVFTAENGQGRRIQKFVNTGMGPVTVEHQGPVWPATAGN